MVVRFVVVIGIILSSAVAHAEDFRFAVGGLVGGSTSGRTSFPAFYIGTVGQADLTLRSYLAASFEARLQAYTHPEDENFGSRGLQLDATLGLRARAGHAFMALQAGAGVLHGWPLDGSAERTGSGLVTTASIGYDSFGAARVRGQLSVTRADLPFHDDSDHKPPWEICACILALLE